MSVKAKIAQFRDMLYFKEVVSARQISAAANKNGIKPSNLSKIIQNWEKALAKKLFVRNSRGLEPTTEALKIAELISGAEKHFDKCLQKISKKNTPGIVNLYLPPNLKIKNLNLFCKKHEGLTLICTASPIEADVLVDYLPPLQTEDWITVQNHIGGTFDQTIWVSCLEEKIPLELAQFIISAMYDQ